MNSSVPIVVVDPNKLFGEGLGKILADGEFNVAGIVADADELPPSLETRQKIVFIFSFEKRICSEKIRLVFEQFSQARIVVLVAEASSHEMRRAFVAGAVGYLSETISPKTLLQSIQLIVDGAPVALASAMPGMAASIAAKAGAPALIARDGGTDGAAPRRAPGWQSSGAPDNNTAHFERVKKALAPYRVSDRELSVLFELAIGSTNRAIAQSLKMTEMAVKAHIKSILRKLSVKNRTQAAIWAATNGIAIAGSRTMPQAAPAAPLNTAQSSELARE